MRELARTDREKESRESSFFIMLSSYFQHPRKPISLPGHICDAGKSLAPAQEMSKLK